MSPASTEETSWLGYFPADYEGARSRFRADCEQARTAADDFCRSFSVQSETDKDLTIDYGYFNHGGDRLIVIQSGIHGAEARAGSAVEALVFKEYLPRLLEKRIDVFFIHSLNPWGFKHDRRTDEYNVNLNRNFVTDAKAYEIDNKYYDQMRSMFEPAGRVGDVSWGSLKSHFRFVGKYIGFGLQEEPISIGMNTGQYKYPKGLNYGGTAPAQQVSFLREQLGPIVARPYRKILFLDFHTGLGNVGELAVITGMNPSPESTRALMTLFGGHEKDGIAVRSENDKGIYPTTGDVTDFVPTLAASATDRVVSVTMEYGTMGSGLVGELRSASRLVLENQAQFFGCATEDVCKAVRENIHEMFSPTDIGWRLKVMREADLAFMILLSQY